MKYQLKVPEVFKELDAKHDCFDVNYGEIVEIDGAIIEEADLTYIAIDKEYKFERYTNFSLNIPEDWMTPVVIKQEVSSSADRFKIDDLYEKYDTLDKKITELIGLLNSLKLEK